MSPNRGSRRSEGVDAEPSETICHKSRHLSGDGCSSGDAFRSEERQVIGYRGRWYDVTNFVGKHPGGDVIKKFVGRDATHVMDSMHRFDVAKMRPTVGSFAPKKDPFGEDMSRLELKLRNEGYYDQSFLWCWYKNAQIMSLFVVVWWLLWCGVADGSNSGRLFCGALLALFWQQSGMLMHEYMHSQLTRKRHLDERFGVFFGTFCFGISARWWKDEHMVHHSLTNTVDHSSGFIDPQADEETWAQNEKLFPFRASKLNRLFIKIQHLTFLPLCLCAGRFGIMIDSMRSERRRDVWFAWALHWFWISRFFSAFATWKSVFLVYAMGCIGEGVLHIQLLLNHYSKRFYDLDEKLRMDHYRAMVECNLNIVCPWWMDWFHGGLNFHHEHHCFPRLPRNRLREVSALIREICARHKVEYEELYFSEALVKTLRNLYAVRNKFSVLSRVAP